MKLRCPKQYGDLALPDFSVSPFFFVRGAGLEMPNHESLTQPAESYQKPTFRGSIACVWNKWYQRHVPLGPSNLQNSVSAAFLTTLLFSRYAGHCRLLSCSASCLPPAMPVPPHEGAASACTPAKVPNPSGSTIRWNKTKGELKTKSFVRAIKALSWELHEPEVSYMSVNFFLLPCFIPLKSLANVSAAPGEAGAFLSALWGTKTS